LLTCIVGSRAVGLCTGCSWGREHRDDAQTRKQPNRDPRLAESGPIVAAGAGSAYWRGRDPAGCRVAASAQTLYPRVRRVALCCRRKLEYERSRSAGGLSRRPEDNEMEAAMTITSCNVKHLSGGRARPRRSAERAGRAATYARAPRPGSWPMVTASAGFVARWFSACYECARRPARSCGTRISPSSVNTKAAR